MYFKTQKKSLFFQFLSRLVYHDIKKLVEAQKQRRRNNSHIRYHITETCEMDDVKK